MNHAQAIAKLRELVVVNEGCPMPQDICQCESMEDCILGALLDAPHSPQCSGFHEIDFETGRQMVGGRCLDKEGRQL